MWIPGREYTESSGDQTETSCAQSKQSGWKPDWSVFVYKLVRRIITFQVFLAALMMRCCTWQALIRQAPSNPSMAITLQLPSSSSFPQISKELCDRNKTNDHNLLKNCIQFSNIAGCKMYLNYCLFITPKQLYLIQYKYQQNQPKHQSQTKRMKEWKKSSIFVSRSYPSNDSTFHFAQISNKCSISFKEYLLSQPSLMGETSLLKSSIREEGKCFQSWKVCTFS